MIQHHNSMTALHNREMTVRHDPLCAGLATTACLAKDTFIGELVLSSLCHAFFT
jgi:hypothetical protein